ncbi:MAG: gliding motility-associated C-terminal domain-containing protein [bacterium]|nr:gliding motility-associated C-terminal domain-containing protein [bacterium]
MNKIGHICFLICFTVLQYGSSFGQSSSPAPYCNGGYTSGNCLQGGPTNTPGNSVNDFIDFFNTTGGNTNITNNNSGCNAGPNNYINYCQHYLAVSPGQTITCNIRSGIIYSQGFAIFVDWNQDNTFNQPGEQVAATSNVPGAATWTVLTFVIPPLQAPGTYRMRVRCAFATPGTNITPCGTFGYGETEDYTLFVGPIPPSSGVPTGTALVNSPVCVGQALNFSLATTYSTPLSYSWTGPGSFSSTLQNPTIITSSLSNIGTYSVLVSNSICPIVRTVSVLVVSYPVFSITPASYTICQGGSLTAIASMITNPTQYSYLWTGPGTIWNPGAQSTLIQPPLQAANVQFGAVNYSVVVTPTVHSCPSSTFITVTINNPVTPQLMMPSPLCNITNGLQLSAVPGGGTWSANPAVTTSGFFSPNLAAIGTNTVSYAVSIGTCIANNTATLLVSQFHSANLGSVLGQICVQDAPIRLMNLPQDTLTGSWFGPNVSANLFTPAGLATGIYNLTYSTVSSNLSYSTISQPNPNTCPSSTILAVSVFNPPIPLITSIAPVCNNAATVALTANPIGGVWIGNAGISPSGIQTPALNLIGTNTLTYTAGQGTCVASSSQTFHVSRFNTAALTATVPHLCVSSSPVNLMSIVQNTNGSWSGLGVNSTNVFNPGGLPTNTYVLSYNTLSSPVATLCPDTRTVGAYVLNPPTASVSLAGPYCSNKPAVQMTVSPSTGSWVPTPYLNSNGIFTPSLSAIGNNVIQYIIGTSTCNAKQTIYVSVEAFVPATIVSQVGDLCNNSPAVNLGPLTANNMGTWSGPGLTGSSFNPAVTNAGVFHVFYKTASSPSGLCPDADTLAIRVFSLAVPIISQVGPFCNTTAPFELQVSPVGGLFGGTNNGAVSPSGLFQPALGITGNNLVSYSISSGPCIAYAQSMIAIEKFVSADFEKQVDPAYCKNHVAFDLNSLVKNPGGFWSGPGVTGSMFNPAKANIGDNNVIVYQTHSSPTALLCPDSSAVRIRVKDFPKVTASSNVTSGCSPLMVLLNSPSYDNGVGTWNIDDGSAPESGFYVSHVFTTPGTYQVVYNYTDGQAYGCSTQVVLPQLIEVWPSPKADFVVDPEEITISDPSATLTNLTKIIGDNTYQWTITGMKPRYEVHPKVSFPQIGTYKVTLTATNYKGCKNELSKYLEVKNDFNVFIPNSFSPNHDGLNDIFLPVFSPFGLDPKSYQLEIYDRWGHIVYGSTDCTKGWDGTYQNKGDTDLKEESYVYKLSFRDLESRVYYKTGSITLVR